MRGINGKHTLATRESYLGTTRYKEEIILVTVATSNQSNLLFNFWQDIFLKKLRFVCCVSRFGVSYIYIINSYVRIHLVFAQWHFVNPAKVFNPEESVPIFGANRKSCWGNLKKFDISRHLDLSHIRRHRYWKEISFYFWNLAREFPASFYFKTSNFGGSNISG